MRRPTLALILSLAWAAGCTQDYDQFNLVDDAPGTGAGSSATASGASTAGSGAGGATGCGSCRIPNGTPECIDGACTVGSCDSGHDDCNAIIADGCEATTDSDPANCGECGRACDPSNASSTICAATLCVSTCNLGRANCTQPATGPDDGCELDVTSDTANCGGCANDCSSQGFGTGLTCQNLACGCTASTQCKGSGNGSATCDTVTGRCACSGTACQQGEACKKQGATQVCACNGGSVCAATETCCQTPAGCMNLQTDSANCGACGRACAPGLSCVAGACE